LGFATDSAALNAEQQQLLELSVPALNRQATVLEMYARADRAGSDAHNLALSRRRLEAVQAHLTRHGASAAQVFGRHCKALGEAFEEAYGAPDGSRSRGGRAVWAFFWSSQDAFREGPTNTDIDIRQLTEFGRAH